METSTPEKHHQRGFMQTPVQVYASLRDPIQQLGSFTISRFSIAKTLHLLLTVTLTLEIKFNAYNM